MAKIPPIKGTTSSTVTVNGQPVQHVSSFVVKFDDGAEHESVAYSINSPIDPNTIVSVNSFGPPHGCLPLLGTGLGDLAEMPWMANIACAGGHRASADITEYIDGELMSTCEGCGERMILPRVPGAVPMLRLKAFVGALMGLAFGEEDEDFNLSQLLGDFADIKRAIAIEDDAVSRAQSLLDIAEKLIQQKLAGQAV